MTIIIDGNNTAHRSYFGYPAMTNKEGQDIRVAYGVLDIIRTSIKNMVEYAIYNEQKPLHVVLTWDSGVPDYRLQHYPEYKNKSGEFDEERYMAIKHGQYMIDQMAHLFGILNIRYYDKAEGDDIVSVLVKQITEPPVVVVSTDTDFYQLISKQVYVFNPHKKKLVKLDDLELPPNQLLEAKVLAGDSSDRLPGIKGIGPAISVQLIKDFGCIQNIYESYRRGTCKGHKHYKLIERIVQQSQYITNIWPVVNLDYSVQACEGLWNYVYSLLEEYKASVSPNSIKQLMFRDGWVKALIGFDAWIRPYLSISNNKIPILSRG